MQLAHQTAPQLEHACDRHHWQQDEDDDEARHDRDDRDAQSADVNNRAHDTQTAVHTYSTEELQAAQSGESTSPKLP